MFVVDTQGDSSLLENEFTLPSSPNATSEDFISLNLKIPKKKTLRNTKSDVYQDYIDNIDITELERETESLKGYYDALNLVQDQENESESTDSESLDELLDEKQHSHDLFITNKNPTKE